jgi:hypothetical protein
MGSARVRRSGCTAAARLPCCLRGGSRSPRDSEIPKILQRCRVSRDSWLPPGRSPCTRSVYRRPLKTVCGGLPASPSPPILGAGTRGDTKHMQQSDVDVLLVLATDSNPIAAAKTLLRDLVQQHRMYLADAAENSTIQLIAGHFARYSVRPRKLRSFLDN